MESWRAVGAHRKDDGGERAALEARLPDEPGGAANERESI
jgi:hypothetical protein